MKKIFLIFMVSFLLSACGGAENNSALSENGSPFSSSEALAYDWGNINISGGTVSKTFTLKNNQAQPVVLTGAVTSCMCTTAYFTLQDGTQSPIFGMQGGDNWSSEVQPEESFDVTVIFDPMAHGPTATGPIARTVNVISKVNKNEKGIIYTRIDVRGNVLSEAEFQASST